MNNFLSIYDLDHNLVQSFIKNAVETRTQKVMMTLILQMVKF